MRESTSAGRGIKGAHDGTKIGDENAAGSSDVIAIGCCCGLLTVSMVDIYRHELEVNEQRDRGSTSLAVRRSLENDSIDRMKLTRAASAFVD